MSQGEVGNACRIRGWPRVEGLNEGKLSRVSRRAEVTAIVRQCSAFSVVSVRLEKCSWLTSADWRQSRPIPAGAPWTLQRPCTHPYKYLGGYLEFLNRVFCPVTMIEDETTKVGLWLRGLGRPHGCFQVAAKDQPGLGRRLLELIRWRTYRGHLAHKVKLCLVCACYTHRRIGTMSPIEGLVQQHLIFQIIILGSNRP